MNTDFIPNTNKIFDMNLKFETIFEESKKIFYHYA